MRRSSQNVLPVSYVFSSDVPHVGHKIRHDISKGVKCAQEEQTEEGAQDRQDPSHWETSNLPVSVRHDRLRILLISFQSQRNISSSEH